MQKMKKLILINLFLLLLNHTLPNVKSIECTNLIIEETQVAEIQIEEIEEIQIEEVEETTEVKTESEVTSRSLPDRRDETEEVYEDKSLEGYRITSYYPGDNCSTGTKTGSGKSTSDFSTMMVEGKQVYTYQGRIVVAGATQELLKSGYNAKGSQEAQNKHYFKYYDTGRIKINNSWYGFIVLDSCGAAMWKGYYRLDIFVPDSSNVIDTKNVEIVYD